MHVTSISMFKQVYAVVELLERKGSYQTVRPESDLEPTVMIVL